MRAYDCMADALDFKRIVGWALTCALIFSIPMLLVKEAYMNFEMKLTNIIFIAVETVAVLILFIFKSRVAVGRLCLGLFGILLSAELVVNADGIYMTDAETPSKSEVRQSCLSLSLTEAAPDSLPHPS